MNLRIISAVILMLAILGGCKQNLYSNLDEREANLMIAALEQNGIPADRLVQEDGQMAVSVDRARFSAAVRLLDDAGLPRQKFASMGEVFQQQGLVSSPTQERARLLYAMSEELSRTVSEIDGVHSARVHIVLPENDPLRRDAVPSSASVFVRHDPGLDIDGLIPRIKTLVANGVAGLSYEKVSVVAVPVPAAAQGVALEPMRNFLGIWMLETSYTQALVLFGGLLGAIAVLAACLAVLWWRSTHRPVTYILEPTE